MLTTLFSQTHLKKQTEAHPLIVLINLPVAEVLLALAVADTRLGHLHADFLIEETLQGVRRMDPAVSVEHILGNVFGVDTVDRITDVLPGSHDEAERYQYNHRDGVMQPEDRGVNVDVVDFDQVLQSAEHVQHCRTALKWTDSSSSPTYRPTARFFPPLFALTVDTLHCQRSKDQPKVSP